MSGIVWGAVLALLVAAGVIVAASRWGDESGALRTFGRDLRAGLHRRRGGTGGDGAPGSAAGGADRSTSARAAGSVSPDVDDDVPVDVQLAELFAEESEPEDGYLQLDELAGLVERAGERASRLLQHVPHRGQEATHDVPGPRGPRA